MKIKTNKKTLFSQINTVINKFIIKVTMMNGKSACTANWHVYTIWNLLIVIIHNGSLLYTAAAMMFNFHTVVALEVSTLKQPIKHYHFGHY